MKRMAYGLYFRATCPRCVVLSWLVWFVTLAAIQRMPVTPGEIESLRAQTNRYGKLFVRGSERVLAGREAVLCLVHLALMRWLVMALLIAVGLKALTMT